MRKNVIVGLLLGALLAVGLLSVCAAAQEHVGKAADIDARIAQLEKRVGGQEDAARATNASVAARLSRVEQRVEDRAGYGVVLILFGAFCALWAQNTGRNPWAWFFLGLLFSVMTVLVLLSKNSRDRAALPLELPRDV